MTYTTKPHPWPTVLKLDHHLRGNTRVAPARPPVTSDSMTADSREGKCLRRTKTKTPKLWRAASCLPHLVGPPEGQPQRQSGEEIKGREELAQHSNRYFLRLQSAAQGEYKHPGGVVSLVLTGQMLPATYCFKFCLFFTDSWVCSKLCYRLGLHKRQ